MAWQWEYSLSIVQQLSKQAPRPAVLPVCLSATCRPQLQDVPWLTALAAACRNKMINFSADQVGRRAGGGD